jgi:hypothetical protein
VPAALFSCVPTEAKAFLQFLRLDDPEGDHESFVPCAGALLALVFPAKS